MTDTPAAPLAGRIPLVFGVTGHRDIPEAYIGEIEADIRRCFVATADEYGAATTALITSLAEGADRIAARAALSLSIPVLVILPMPEADYMADFQTEASKNEFFSLLQRAETVYTLPPPAGYTAEEVATPGKARDAAYERAGLLMAKSCQILVACWDGKATNRQGGTEQIIHAMLNGYTGSSHTPAPPRCWIRTGPVLHVFTPRSDTKPEEIEAGHSGFKILLPKDKDEENVAKEIRAHVGPAEAFNRALDELHGSKGVATSIRYLGDFAETLTGSGSSLLRRYAVADHLAVVYKKNVERHIQLAGLLGLLGVAAKIFTPYAGAAAPYMPALFLLFLLVAILSWRRSKRLDLKNRFTEYRALAEGTRVQIFWLLAGVREPLGDYYPNTAEGTHGWVSHALLTGDLYKTTGELDSPSLPTVHEHWLQSQLDYFTSASEKQDRQAKRLKKATSYLLLGTFAIGLFSSWLEPDARNMIMNLLPILPVLAGALRAYMGTMGLKEQIIHYRHMGDMFARSAEYAGVIDKEGDDKDALLKSLYKELGIEFAQDNISWLTMHDTKQIGMPALKAG